METMNAHVLPTIDSPFNAFVQTLVLAVTAPTDKQARQAMALAEDMIARFELSPVQVDEAKRVARGQLKEEE